MRLPGHHVAWLPGPESELKLVHRILDLYEQNPPTRIAKILNAEGIPSPNAGRTKMIRGVKQPVSGLWRPFTINSIVHNPLLVAMAQYGRRSVGDQRRFAPEGPRLLADQDRREDFVPKTVNNDPKLIVKSAAKFERLITEDRASRLHGIHEQRGGTQRGKPRSRDPNRNPLGGRVFDWNCGWPMYRTPCRASFNYTCAWYLQSHATHCNHNHLRGLAATKMALAAVGQQILTPPRRQRIEERLKSRIAELISQPRAEQELDRFRAELREVQASLQKANRNFALADKPELADAVKAIIGELHDRQSHLNNEIAKHQDAQSVISANEILDSALDMLGQLPALADDDDNLADIGRVFRTLNLQMFVRFHKIQKGKRAENKVSGGVITLGDASPPITKYTGPTAIRAVKSQKPCHQSKSTHSDGETTSSRNDRHAER